MNFVAADALLTGRNRDSRKLGNNTYLVRVDNDTIAVRLHTTNVVTFYRDGREVLDSGGWRTVTTKDRMNSYSSVAVFQQNHVWYVAFRSALGRIDFNHAVKFYDGMDVQSPRVQDAFYGIERAVVEVVNG